MESTNGYHRPLIFSRARSSSKKSSSSLKRSKSLHCPKMRQPDSNQNVCSSSHIMSPPYSAGFQPRSHAAAAAAPYYASRRHHSTNDYFATESEETTAFPFVLNSSSHNLYNQFQNGQQPPSSVSQTKGSCSSGTSLASLSESGYCSRKPSDYYEDVFLEMNPSPSLCVKLGALSLTDANQQNSYQQRYRTGSNSSSSLQNNTSNNNNNDLSVFFDALEAEHSEDNIGDDFTLEPLQETQFEKSHSTPTKKSWIHGTHGTDHFRFYIIKQRNYPPFYLETLRNRRRIYRILVLGYPSSGKSTLIEQFGLVLAQCDSTRFNPAASAELDVSTNLLIHMVECDSFDKYLLQMPVTDYQPDVYLILYSINNRDSFNSVKKTLIDLQRWDDVETKSIIIVANKSDLVRGRCVTRREGRDLASSNNCKYIETSCTISHNIDVLLQGIGFQICLKEKEQLKQKEHEQTNEQVKMKRKPSFFKRILRKTAINKSKSCDNLHVL